MVSKKTKANLGGIVGVVGVILVVAIILLVIFGDLWSKIYVAGSSSLTAEGYMVVIALAIGIAMAVIGLSFAYRIGIVEGKKEIADFINPILKSKGKVSFLEIAKHIKLSTSIDNWADALKKNYLEPMIKEGYLENVRLEEGWVVSTAPILCSYCGAEIPSGAKKCPHCGAAVKK